MILVSYCTVLIILSIKSVIESLSFQNAVIKDTISGVDKQGKFYTDNFETGDFFVIIRSTVFILVSKCAEQSALSEYHTHVPVKTLISSPQSFKFQKTSFFHEN